jgi:hypothetical protein
MTYKICYWDPDAKAQRERDATPDEIVEIDARKGSGPSDEELRSELRQIDLDSIGPLRDGDKPALAALSARAAEVRAKMKKAK